MAEKTDSQVKSQNYYFTTIAMARAGEWDRVHLPPHSLHHRKCIDSILFE